MRPRAILLGASFIQRGVADVKPRNVDGRPRVFGIRDDKRVARRASFYDARNAMRPGQRVVVSYDEGSTWYDLGKSPVSKDDRKH